MAIRGILITKNYQKFTIMDEAFETVLTTFEGARAANPALHGDLVEYTEGQLLRVIKRAKHPVLTGVLDLKSRTIYGLTARSVPIYLFYPYDRRYPPFRVGSSEKDRTINRIALVEIGEFDKKDTFPRGNLVQLLGCTGDMALEAEALAHAISPYCKIKSHLLPPVKLQDGFSRKMIDEGWTTVNIDPDGCKDIDDLISFKTCADGSWDFIISIADVDSIVSAGSELDLYAQNTLQTIYNDGVAVRPMLPPVFSEGLCSLIPGSPRAVVALTCKYIAGNEPGKRIVNVQFEMLHIVNHKSYTYDNIIVAEDFPVDVLKACASEINGFESLDSHEWIAALMKFYNLQAAAILGPQGIYRTHSGPRLEQLKELSAILPSDVAAALSNSAATYELGGTAGHHGFDNMPYCHASSPIRRYADLYNQRLIKQFIKSESKLTDGLRQKQLVYRLNEVSKSAKLYDRISCFLKNIESTSQVDALVISISKIYIVPWKMTFKMANEYPMGSTIRVKYYYDASQINWSSRLVFTDATA